MENFYVAYIIQLQCILGLGEQLYFSYWIGAFEELFHLFIYLIFMFCYSNNLKLFFLFLQSKTHNLLFFLTTQHKNEING